MILLCSSFVWAADGKITVGYVEEVILLPWGIKMPARVDTGAGTSSLDVRELSVRDNIVEFKLPEKYGGLAIRLPLVHWKTIRSAMGKGERPVVEIEMCLGSKRIRTLVNLNDRSSVTYPMLLGRNTLKNNFIVDCDRSFCTVPVCPEARPK
jgi:hypothetical protein